MIVIGLTFKLAYDIGYFNAQSIKDTKNADLPTVRPVLTVETAQRIVTGALKEDPGNPKTIVQKVIDDNQQLATIMIESDKLKKVAWIINMRLFFVGDLFNDDGFNLTEGIEKQNNIYHGGD